MEAGVSAEAEAVAVAADVTTISVAAAASKSRQLDDRWEDPLSVLKQGLSSLHKVALWPKPHALSEGVLYESPYSLEKSQIRK